MKKSTFAMLLALCAAGVSARDLAVNDEFKGSKPDAVQPAGWVKAYATHPKIGASKVVAGKEAGKFAISVKLPPKGFSTPFVSLKRFNVKAGEVLELKAKVTGNGRFMMGYYAFNGNARIGSKDSKIFTINGGGEFEDKLTITKFKEKETTAIQIFFTTHPGSDLVFHEIDAEIED
ncbi:MAG: hypothetical protein IJZ19_11510 [Lentisphaeria bacterium]|nr:hypothetical protein [Lentisphaeria bacterium]MBQ8755649.1 hypothetical protein [Lentisphaeria bacterium]